MGSVEEDIDDAKADDLVIDESYKEAGESPLGVVVSVDESSGTAEVMYEGGYVGKGVSVGDLRCVAPAASIEGFNSEGVDDCWLYKLLESLGELKFDDDAVVKE